MPPDPKDPAVRARRNRVSTEADIEVAAARKPPLGRYRPDSKADSPVAWHRETRRWWKTIWESPIAGRWIDAHVPGLRQMARLVDDYWGASDPQAAKLIHAELRLAMREFGLTPMAARGLNWSFRRPVAAPVQSAPLAPGADPRKVLSMTGRRRSG